MKTAKLIDLLHTSLRAQNVFGNEANNLTTLAKFADALGAAIDATGDLAAAFHEYAHRGIPPGTGVCFVEVNNEKDLQNVNERMLFSDVAHAALQLTNAMIGIANSQGCKDEGKSTALVAEYNERITAYNEQIIAMVDHYRKEAAV